MSKCKEHKNPLIWGGTSQAERFPQALDPGSLDIDNKSTSVLVDEAFVYAGALNYYNSRNEAEGDWQPFFESLKKALEGKGITLNGELPPHTRPCLSPSSGSIPNARKRSTP